MSKELQYEDYIDMIRKLAHRWTRRSNLSFEELFSQGNLLYVKIKGRFDESFGTKFSTYLYKTLEKGLGDYVGRQDRNEEVSYDETCEYNHYEEPMQEKKAVFRSWLENSSEDVQEMVNCVLNDTDGFMGIILKPVHKVNGLKYNEKSIVISKKVLYEYFLNKGWKKVKINKTFLDIEKGLKEL